MVVSNTTCRTSVVGSDTAGQEVPFEFPILDSSELLVITRVTATGVENTLIELTDYTIEIDDDSGGTVTMINAIAGTLEIHLIRQTPTTQLTDLTIGGAFNAETIELSIDKTIKILVEHADLWDRTIHSALTDTVDVSLELPDADERASCYLAFDATGAVIATDVLETGTASISTFGASLIDDANASAAQTTLGFGTSVKSLLDDTSISAMQTTLGISTFIKTLIDDLTAAEARQTLEVVNVTDDIVCWENDVVCDDNNVVSYL